MCCSFGVLIKFNLLQGSKALCKHSEIHVKMLVEAFSSERIRGINFSLLAASYFKLHPLIYP